MKGTILIMIVMDSFFIQICIASAIIFIIGLATFLIGFLHLVKDINILINGTVSNAIICNHHIQSMGKRYITNLCFATEDGYSVKADLPYTNNYHFVYKHPIGSELKIKYMKNNPKQILNLNNPVRQISFAAITIFGFGIIFFSFFMLISGFISKL